jgi:3',5'-cyclic AMP phosphodiesterase CpdA
MLTRRSFLAACPAFVASIIMNSCAITKKLIQPGQPFGFIVCNDPHVDNDTDLANLEKVVRQWTKSDFQWDFLVICGDISQSASPRIFESVKRCLEGTGKPFFPLMGNHDNTGPGAEGKSNYKKTFGKNRLDYYIIHKGVALIFLDLSDGKGSNVSVRPETKRWLEQALDRIPKAMPLIVFSHFPLHPDTPRFAVQNTGQLFGLLDNRMVMAYFSGHFHANWQAERKGVGFFTNVRLLPNVKNHQDSRDTGYCVVQVHDFSVDVEYRTMEFL